MGAARPCCSSGEPSPQTLIRPPFFDERLWCRSERILLELIRVYVRYSVAQWQTLEVWHDIGIPEMGSPASLKKCVINAENYCQ